MYLKRIREAIECQKRALIGASKTDTFGPAALAELYENLKDFKESTNWHKRVIDVCVHVPSDIDSPSHSPSPSSPSSPPRDTISLSQAQGTVNLWAKSAIAVGRNAIGQPLWENNIIGGTRIPAVVDQLQEAKRFLEIVAGSNAAEAGEAEMIIRRIGDMLRSG